MSVRRCAWLMLFALAPGAACAQDRIEEIRQEVNAADNSRDTRKSKANSNDNMFCDDNSSSWWDELFGEATWKALAFPYWLPHRLLHDDFQRDNQFAAYPYANQYPGYLWQGRWLGPELDSLREAELPSHCWSVRLSSEDGNDFHGLNRVGIRAALDSAWRAGLQSNWNYLREIIGGRWRDQTLLGDTSVTYRFAQHERIEMYSGLGFRVLTDPRSTNWGANFVYGLDWFPARPLVVSASFDAGNLGSASVIHSRATVGAAVRRCELFGGYDFLRIGSVNVQGPTAGLRLWF